ncbi:peptidase S24 [Phenylobacterium sp. LH3H17]|uniref:peptidase S24 n=1 Tax=Phenylobacterium sp. LH3H17 TaxID=2903901 RepID=UPI0020C961D1|nr:peptidase S24 [Phenylobacterium sp. LH3H17]UTP38264.1 peptidase S24 [Phenylobacterium sp. LH3H17]
MSSTDRPARLKLARQDAGFPTAAAAAFRFGWNRNTYSSNENGNADFSYRRAKVYAAAFGVRPEWLYEGQGTPDTDVTAVARPPFPRMVPVIGRVGADTEGRVLFATGQEAGDLAPIPPGGTEKAVALLIVGHSMRGVADDGGLIYFEDQRTPPTPDMLGHMVVVETAGDEVLVKRLLRGSKAGRFDLESVVGDTRQNCKLRWAAHITAIIPPHQARRIIRSGGV